MKVLKTIALLCLLCGFALTAGAEDSKGKVSVWSFTDEIEGFLDEPGWGYKATHPNVTVESTKIPTDEFPTALDKVLLSGKNVPDVIALEEAFVRKYVESGYLLPLDDLYKEIKKKMADYPMKVGTYEGHVYAMSWQVAPGAMFYRRSLAKKYLGTDDPKQVQKYFSNMDKFLETARLLKKKSNGRCRVVSTSGDIFIPSLYARKKPWVVDGKLYVDPAMEKYMDMCKTIYEEKLDGRIFQWGEGWYAGMEDRLTDNRGNSLEVFSYFLPTWGLHYVLKLDAPATSGDWAICAGPVPYRWGGTWLAAYNGTNNPDAAKEMIKYIVSDEGFLENYALASWDLVGNYNVQKKVKNTEYFFEPYLGGQNQYAEFCEYAKKVNGSLVQSSDAAIESIFSKYVSAYCYDEMTKEQALRYFKREVHLTLGF